MLESSVSRVYGTFRRASPDMPARLVALPGSPSKEKLKHRTNRLARAHSVSSGFRAGRGVRNEIRQTRTESRYLTSKRWLLPRYTHRCGAYLSVVSYPAAPGVHTNQSGARHRVCVKWETVASLHCIPMYGSSFATLLLSLIFVAASSADLHHVYGAPHRTDARVPIETAVGFVRLPPPRPQSRLSHSFPSCLFNRLGWANRSPLASLGLSFLWARIAESQGCLSGERLRRVGEAGRQQPASMGRNILGAFREGIRSVKTKVLSVFVSKPSV